MAGSDKAGDKPNQGGIGEFVLAAGEYVRRATGLELDGSVESLAYVDHYLHNVGPVSDDVLALVARSIGAYFGEVVATQLGAEWENLDEEPAAWTMRITNGGDGDPAGGEPLLRFRPVAMAAEAIREGEVADYDATISAPPSLSPALTDALERVSPVEQSYYYSLTGRFETLEHMLDLLIEIRRGTN